MFQGVTNMPNLVAFNSLYPWSWTSNYGDSIQFNVMSTDIPADVAYRAQNCINPGYWGWRNLAITSMPIWQPTQNDYLTQLSLHNAYNQGYQLGENIKLQGSFKTTAGDIGTMKAQIDLLLKKENLPAEQQTKLENIKKQLEELETKYAELTKNTQGKSAEKLKEELEAIKGQLITLKEQAAEIAESIPAAAGTGAGEGTSTGSATGTGSGSAVGTGSGAGTGTEGAAGSGTQTGITEQQQELYKTNQICKMLDKAIDGMGTDYDGEQGMKTVIEALVDKDNVIEVWDQWNKTYGQQGSYKDDEYGFIETLMDDCEFGQKEEISNLLIDALEQRAIEKGIDVDSEVAAARNSCKSNWFGWRNDDKICEAMIALYNKVKA